MILRKCYFFIIVNISVLNKYWVIIEKTIFYRQIKIRAFAL